MGRNLLLMSSSRSATAGFLEANAAAVTEILAGCKRALFIPYAVVGDGFEDRLKMVAARMQDFGIQTDHITDAEDPVAAVEHAEAVLVSGGNTFCLLKALYDNALVEVLRERCEAGLPYLGWSAGSNVAGKSIRTTNDMPIDYPPSFDALGLLPFQLNPHYTDAMPDGIKGETRQQRIEEFLAVNPDERVVGLPEGTALRITGNSMHLLGEHDAWLFEAGNVRRALPKGSNLSELL